MADPATSVLSSAIEAATSAAATTTAADDMVPPCDAGNEYNGEIGLRVSAIFVILVGSMLGAVFPVWARSNPGVHVPSWVFFIAKYFGSGVIIATAFIHLLAPANEALTNPCLTGPITAYSWVEGIALMTVFALFFVELMAMRFAVFDPTHPGDSPDHPSRSQSLALARKEGPDLERQPAAAARRNSAHIPGEDHLGHSRAHVGEDHEHEHDHRHESGIPLAPAPGSKSAAGPGSNDALWRASLNARPPAAESYSAQLTAIFILEFGVIFHSIFIGLTLAVAGAEFRTLYVVLVFHQTFEGLGLGSRLAVVPWPRHVSTKPGGQRRMPLTPYALAVGYGLSTPVAIAIGLGVREAYQPAGQTNLIVNGVFDSISAGILIYTGLVELMAHEFMFSGVMRRAELRVVLAAFGTMCLGAGLMALLGKWA